MQAQDCRKDNFFFRLQQAQYNYQNNSARQTGLSETYPPASGTEI